ncbi:hypothetical protein AGDE_13412 [Angomonas deanei]|nr:hypothetical protein AGDE_13412 [Angomonas deanei]|eukprot:EPY22368.1 hypothetical protein AGDE_13412 [Angomonas deanei]
MSETGCVTLRGGKGNEVLRSDVVRLLFDEVTVRDDASVVVGVKAVCHLETLVSFSWWNSLTDELDDVDSEMSTQVDVVVHIPDNWETPSASVECTLPPKKVMHCNVEFHCQDFFLSLKNVQPILSHDVTVQSTPRSRRSPSVRPGELSQKILLSLSPSRKAEVDEECFFRGVTLEEMMEVVEHSEECVGVRVLSTPVGAPLAFNKFTTVVDEDSYTLIFAPQSVFRLLITGEKGNAAKDVGDLFPEGQEAIKKRRTVNVNCL